MAVPELQRVFVSVPGDREVAVIDVPSLKVVARVPAGEFPDGLAYAPAANRIFVSDERGKREIVIDARTTRSIDTIGLGGEAGNTQYDSVAHQILVNVQTRNQLVVIDPLTAEIVARHPLPGGERPHGLLVVPDKRLAFVACEGDAKLLVVELAAFAVTQVLPTGPGPDVLAFDSGLQRLYVATESDVVSVFQLRDRPLEKLEDLHVAPNAHSIAVNPTTHDVYLPLKEVGGRPVLRIMTPSSP